MLLILFSLFLCVRVCMCAILSRAECVPEYVRCVIVASAIQHLYVKYTNNICSISIEFHYLVQRPDQLPLIVIKSGEMNRNNKRIPF